MRIKIKRRRLMEFHRFLVLLLAHLHGGLDLASSWWRAERCLRESFPESSKLEFVFAHLMSEKLLHLGEHFILKEYRPWFGVLLDALQSGHALVPLVRSLETVVAQEIENQWKVFEEELETRVNCLILLFFLPPSLWMLVSPFTSLFDSP